MHLVLQDCISKLLQKVPGERLGSRLGAEEVMRHPFFAETDFATLRSRKPPYIPPVQVRTCWCQGCQEDCLHVKA